MSEAANTRMSWALAALLVAGTALVYAPVAGFDFVAYDDRPYVTENPAVRAGLTAEGVRWAFSAFHSSNWHPLTWLSHMLDVELFQLDAGRHHVTSVLLHALNAVLCLFALQRLGLTLVTAFAASVLFAFHPLRVESVAWIAERKDVLSGTFFFSTLWFWAGHVRSGGTGFSWKVMACFAAGLLAKPMLVTLPVVLLLLDRWPLGRVERYGWRALALEKLPLLALAAASACVTLLAQGRGGAIQPFERLPLDVRLAHAPVAVLGYLGRFFWPSSLACYYPHPALAGAEPPAVWSATALLAGACVLGATVVALVLARRRPSPVSTGWLWFVVMLAPVIGIVQVGGQSLADRYAYLPLVGFSLVFLPFFAAWTPARVQWSAIALVGVILGVSAHRQVRVWSDTVTLFAHAVSVTGDNPVASTNLGSALAEAGLLDEAEPHLVQAIELAPRDPRPATSYATLLYLRDQLDEARVVLEQALVAAPDFADALRVLGGVLAAQGDEEGAIAAFRRTLQVNSRDTAVHFELGRLLAARDDRAGALEHHRAALALDPGHPEAGLSLSWILATSEATPREKQEALAWARRAVEASGGRDPAALDVLAAALAAGGQFDAAQEAQRRALQLGSAEEVDRRQVWLERYVNRLSLAPTAGGAGQ